MTALKNTLIVNLIYDKLIFFLSLTCLRGFELFEKILQSWRHFVTKLFKIDAHASEFPLLLIL